MMFKVALKILRQQEDAEDCVQDAMVLVIRHWGSFRGDCKASSWVHTIVRNAALTMLRARQSRRYTAHVSLDDMPMPPTCRSHEEPILARVAIDEACGSMSPLSAEVVRLRAAGERQMDMMPAFNKTLQFRALHELRTILESPPVRPLAASGT